MVSVTYDELFRCILLNNFTHAAEGVDWRYFSEENNVLIMFQGSATDFKNDYEHSVQDWKHNLQFLPKAVKPYKNMKTKWYAHKGFVTMYHAVRDDILKAMKPYMADYEFVIAGHSQGGALAQLCAEDLIFNGVQQYKIKCITFGSPKVFYGRNAKKMLNPIKCVFENIENGSDIVPKLPPFAFNPNPIHVGEKFSLKNVLKTVDYHMGYDDKELYK